MDVGRGLARIRVISPGGQERDDIVAGHGLERGDGLGRRWRGGRDRGNRLLGHGARLGVRGQHERLHLAPQLVLVRLAPDVAHFRQRVALNHDFYPAPSSAPLPSVAGPPDAISRRSSEASGRRSATSGATSTAATRISWAFRPAKIPTGMVASAAAAAMARSRTGPVWSCLRRLALPPRNRAAPTASTVAWSALMPGAAASACSDRSSSPAPKTIHHSAAPTARPSTALASRCQLTGPARLAGPAAPIPTAATDSPIATITRALWRSLKWLGRSSKRPAGCTISGDPSWTARAATQSTYPARLVAPLGPCSSPAPVTSSAEAMLNGATLMMLGLTRKYR